MNNKLILTTALQGSLITLPALAEQPRIKHRHSFQTEVTRSTDAGRSMTRRTEQVASENRFQRQTQVQTGAGKSASRSVSGEYDPETRTYTRQLEGTRFNGDEYSAQRQTQKTENGLVRTRTRTNADGETASGTLTRERDREQQTLTQQIEATGFDGQTYTATRTRSRLQAGEEPAGE